MTAKNNDDMAKAGKLGKRGVDGKITRLPIGESGTAPPKPQPKPKTPPPKK